jgi:hypothetical protein
MTGTNVMVPRSVLSDLPLHLHGHEWHGRARFEMSVLDRKQHCHY